MKVSGAKKTETGSLLNTMRLITTTPIKKTGTVLKKKFIMG
jgi:hypothetical protein